MIVHEIARLAGVSIGTVDRILHKRGRVSAETRARIGAIIEKHQFTPSPIAQRLKRNRPYHFCALIPRRDQDTGYWRQIIAGIERATGEIKSLGVETEIVEFDCYTPDAFEQVSDSVAAGKPDGLIFAPIMPLRTWPFVEKICTEKKSRLCLLTRIFQKHPRRVSSGRIISAGDILRDGSFIFSLEMFPRLSRCWTLTARTTILFAAGTVV